MKRSITICIIIIAFSMLGTAKKENLTDVYRSGVLKIKADPEFGKDTDWNTVFSDYYRKSVNNKQLGKLKNIVIAGDGSIFVSNYGSYSVYKFDNNGNFIKSFGKEGTRRGTFLMRPTVGCALEQRYIITSESNGRLNFFDPEGNFGKLVQIDYMSRGIIPINENTIAIAGWVLYKGGRIRYIVSFKDIDSGKERIVHSEFRSRKTQIISEEPYMVIPGSDVRNEFILQKISKDYFVVGNSDSSELVIYNNRGNEVIRVDHGIIPLTITEREREEFRKSSLRSLESVRVFIKEAGKSEEGINKAIAIINDPEFNPGAMPYFYDLMTDSDGNILIFTYTDEQELHTFRVYSPQGDYICETRIDPGDYNININYRFRNIVFNNGNLYCLAELKHAEGIPLRLIKVNLK